MGKERVCGEGVKRLLHPSLQYRHEGSEKKKSVLLSICLHSLGSRPFPRLFFCGWMSCDRFSSLNLECDFYLFIYIFFAVRSSFLLCVCFCFVSVFLVILFFICSFIYSFFIYLFFLSISSLFICSFIYSLFLSIRSFIYLLFFSIRSIILLVVFFYLFVLLISSF